MDPMVWGEHPLKDERVFESLEEIRASTGQDQHSRMVNYDVFRELKPSKSPAINIEGNHDFSLNPDSTAVDAGVPLANINDGFTGKAPDLGAWEVDQPVPSYGTSVEADARYWWSIAGPQAGENAPASAEVHAAE